MIESGDLKQIEKKAYRSTYQDGLYDLCYGIFLLAWAVVPLIRDAGVSLPLAALPFLAVPAIILLAGKKYITVPRMGRAKFGEQRLTKATRLFGAGAVTLLISYLLIIVVSVWGIRLSGLRTLGDMTLPLVESVVVLVGVSALAYFSEFRRLYLYAFFFAGGIPLAELLYHYVGTPLDELIAFGIPGLAVIVIGLVLLANFVRKYPRANPGVI